MDAQTGIVRFNVILYVLIIAVCVSGYLSSSYTRWDTTVWWLVDTAQKIAAPDEDMNMFYSNIHLWTAWALLAAVAVHVTGGVYHAFRNDGKSAADATLVNVSIGQRPPQSHPPVWPRQVTGMHVVLLPFLEDARKLDRYIASCQIGFTSSSLILGA